VAGKYLYVYGTMDDDGFYQGESECRATTLTLLLTSLLRKNVLTPTVISVCLT
jgi:hypothetical protein